MNAMNTMNWDRISKVGLFVPQSLSLGVDGKLSCFFFFFTLSAPGLTTK